VRISRKGLSLSLLAAALGGCAANVQLAYEPGNPPQPILAERTPSLRPPMSSSVVPMSAMNRGVAIGPDPYAFA